MTPNPNPSPAACADCGLRYDDPSWVDMVLSHEEWVKLDPTVTAILCMTCMAKRAAKAGFVPAVEGLYGALSLSPQALPAPGEVEAGQVVLEGRGDGTYAEAERAIRGLIALVTQRKADGDRIAVAKALARHPDSSWDDYEWEDMASYVRERFLEQADLAIAALATVAAANDEGVAASAKVADDYAAEFKGKTDCARDIVERRIFEAHHFAGKNLAAALRPLLQGGGKYV